MKNVFIASGPVMTAEEQRRISTFIEEEFGIRMPESKKSLLEGRLAKRVVKCAKATYREYFDFILRDPQGRDEFLVFQDLVSTHETSFFREERHFQYLEQGILPSLLGQENRKSLDVLSAPCSTGEEVYSLAMVIDKALEVHRRRTLPFLVEGIDLSTRAIAIADRAVYLADRTKTIPLEVKHRYLMHSKNRDKPFCRIVPELRERVVFHPGNLLNSLNLLQPTYDIILCRNVLIYFDQANQRSALSRLLNHLKPKGFLFLGHSESMLGLNLPVRSVAQAVFQKT